MKRKITLIEEAKNLKTISAIAEWWCRIMKLEIDTKDELTIKTIKDLADKYWDLLYNSCEVFNPAPLTVGKVKKEEAEKLREVITKYGYQTPVDFNRELFVFHAHTIGVASNFDMFMV